MQSLLAKPLDDVTDDPGVWDGRTWKGAAWTLGGIHAGLAAHVVHPLRAIVKRRERVVVDRPGR